MKRITDKELLASIRYGGPALEAALKAWITDPDWNRSLAEWLVRLGVNPVKTGMALADAALIELVSEVRRGIFPAVSPLKPFLLDRITLLWQQQLKADPLARQEVMETISSDPSLKIRIFRRLRNLGCDEQGRTDYYQQGFVQLERILREGKYQGGDVKGLFFRICENLRRNDRRKRREELPGELPDREVSDLEHRLDMQERRSLIRNWLGQVGEKCRKTLQMWNDGFTMKDIAEAIPYKDEGEAAVARHRCLKKIYQLIDERLWT